MDDKASPYLNNWFKSHMIVLCGPYLKRLAITYNSKKTLNPLFDKWWTHGSIRGPGLPSNALALEASLDSLEPLLVEALALRCLKTILHKSHTLRGFIKIWLPKNLPKRLLEIAPLHQKSPLNEQRTFQTKILVMINHCKDWFIGYTYHISSSCFSRKCHKNGVQNFFSHKMTFQAHKI